jgi:tRNA(Ile)-lysidine synthase
MTTLEKKVLAFIKENMDGKDPLLVAFSGGEDSLALVHCLSQLKIPLHLAHFDHGWREESGEQAQSLQRWAQEKNIPFFTQRSKDKGQSELHAREERYAFFEKLMKGGNYQALVLAHHQLDQVETVLKRVFEGAHLFHLKGMLKVGSRKGFLLWRPLLKVSKKEVLDYLKTHHLNPIDDPTNGDLHYLRARMRNQLLPHLSTLFGKEVIPSLERVGDYAASLEEYLHLQTKDHSCKKGPFGEMWDFAKMHPVEIEYILCKALFPTPSQHILRKIQDAIASGVANYKVVFSNQNLVVDRQKVYRLAPALPRFEANYPLKTCTISEAGWTWEVKVEEHSSQNAPDGRDVWKGAFSMSLPQGNYSLSAPGGFYRKLWNEKKIPAFLRPCIPMVTLEGRPYAEFLTGISRGSSSQLLVKIRLKGRI